MRLALLALAISGCLAYDVDVLVIGGTASGIAAGISAANGVGGRHTVHIFEQLPMLGGMAVAGGVGLMNNENGVYGQGLGGRWCALNGLSYNSSKPNCFPEMHIGEASFWQMVNGTANLTLSLGCPLLTVERAGALLTAAIFLCENNSQPLRVTARVFIDATYDGDAMVAAGVTHAHGREAAAEFNESLAGVLMHHDTDEAFGNLGISPFWPDGSLIRGVSPEPLPPSGTADDRTRRGAPSHGRSLPATTQATLNSCAA